MVSERIYCVGGFTSEFTGQSEVYTPENDSWSPIAPMPTARAYLGLAEVKDVLYAIGGFDGSNWLATNEMYTPTGYGLVPPKIQITSPTNKTYSSVSLDFTLNRDAQWIGYSLDGLFNVSIHAPTKLFTLAQGSHNIKMYANDSAGNMGVSNTVYFSVDSIPPTIFIVQPQNKSYDVADIPMTFAINENASISYSLDGQANVSIVGNVTLPALSTGSHTLTIYATDDVGNSGSQTTYFNVAPFPFITLVAVASIVTIAAAGGYLFFKRRKTGTEKNSGKVKSATDEDASKQTEAPIKRR